MMAFPLIGTVQALSSPGDLKKAKFWLAYWIIAFFTLFLSTFVLEMTLLSLINSIRLIFIIWLQYPVNDAPSKVFNLAKKQIL